MKRTLRLLALLLALPVLAVAQTTTTKPGGLSPETFGHTAIYLGVMNNIVVFDTNSGCDPAALGLAARGASHGISDP